MGVIAKFIASDIKAIAAVRMRGCYLEVNQRMRIIWWRLYNLSLNFRADPSECIACGDEFQRLGKARMQTILLADDHPVVLYGLERFLSGAGDFEIVASCRDGSAALPIIRDKKPDLALLDVDMPGLSGFYVLAATVSEVLSTRVVLLSESATHTDVSGGPAQRRMGHDPEDLYCMRDA